MRRLIVKADKMRKAAAMPVGHVSMHSDGTRWRKVAAGKWEPAPHHPESEPGSDRRRAAVAFERGYAEHTKRKLASDLAMWVYRSTGKARLLKTYEALPVADKEALDVDTQHAVNEHHGGDYVTVYRSMRRGDKPGSMGGASVTTQPDTRPSRDDVVHVFQVHHKDVMLHWSQHRELDSPAYGHEKEVILKPGAEPEHLGIASPEQLAKAVASIKHGEAAGQMGMFGGAAPVTVKGHIRRSKTGKVSLVKQHERVVEHRPGAVAVANPEAFLTEGWEESIFGSSTFKRVSDWLPKEVADGAATKLHDRHNPLRKRYSFRLRETAGGKWAIEARPHRNAIMAPLDYPEVVDLTDPEFGGEEIRVTPGLDLPGSRYLVGTEREEWTRDDEGWFVAGDGRKLGMKDAVTELQARGARLMYLPGGHGLPAKQRAAIDQPLVEVAEAPAPRFKAGDRVVVGGEEKEVWSVGVDNNAGDYLLMDPETRHKLWTTDQGDIELAPDPKAVLRAQMTQAGQLKGALLDASDDGRVDAHEAWRLHQELDNGAAGRPGADLPGAIEAAESLLIAPAKPAGLTKEQTFRMSGKDLEAAAANGDPEAVAELARRAAKRPKRITVMQTMARKQTPRPAKPTKAAKFAATVRKRGQALVDKHTESANSYGNENTHRRARMGESRRSGARAQVAYGARLVKLAEAIEGGYEPTSFDVAMGNRSQYDTARGVHHNWYGEDSYGRPFKRKGRAGILLHRQSVDYDQRGNPKAQKAVDSWNNAIKRLGVGQDGDTMFRLSPTKTNADIMKGVYERLKKSGQDYGWRAPHLEMKDHLAIGYTKDRHNVTVADAYADWLERTDPKVTFTTSKWQAPDRTHNRAPLAERIATATGQEASRFKDPAHKRIPGYFPTPITEGVRAVDVLDAQPGMTVLEPSAGTGELADQLPDDVDITVGEFDARLRKVLEDKGYKGVQTDALKVEGQFDRVLMNPPFEKGQDMAHVLHAFHNNLKPGGRLVAIVSASTTFRQDRATQAFREFVDEHRAEPDRKIDPGAWKRSGTAVNAVRLVLDKPDSMTKGRRILFLLRKAVQVGPPPTPNRKKHPYQGSVEMADLPAINIENRRGSTRRGVGLDGDAWAIKMRAHYGEFAGTMGTDGDPVDCYVGPDDRARYAYVIHQKWPRTEVFDEDKVMLGFPTAEAAEAMYRLHYDGPGFYGGMTRWPVEELAETLRGKEHRGKRLDRPGWVGRMVKGARILVEPYMRGGKAVAAHTRGPRLQVHAGMAYVSRTRHRGHSEAHDAIQDLVQGVKDGSPTATRTAATWLSRHPSLQGFDGVVIPAPRSDTGKPMLHGLAEALVAEGVGQRAVSAVTRTEPVVSSRIRRHGGSPGLTAADHAATMTADLGDIDPYTPILIADDVFTTGATLRAVERTLRRAGHRGPIHAAVVGHYVEDPAHVPDPLSHATVEGRDEPKPVGLFKGVRILIDMALAVASTKGGQAAGQIGMFGGAGTVKSRPGMALLPSKENPRVKRWQQTQEAAKPEPEAPKKPATFAEQKAAAKALTPPAKLPDDLDVYFENPEGAIDVPLDKLTPIRARKKGIESAKKYMWAAHEGIMDRRKPLDLKDNQDGTYTVLDGNSTFATAKASGWANLRGKVVRKAEPHTRVTLDDPSQLRDWWTENVGDLLPQVKAHHMTIKHRPSDAELGALSMGGAAGMKIAGYAQDDKAQAVVVEPQGVDSANAVPHVTVAVAAGVSAAHSNELLARGYTKVDGPVLKGTIGSIPPTVAEPENDRNTMVWKPDHPQRQDTIVWRRGDTAWMFMGRDRNTRKAQWSQKRIVGISHAKHQIGVHPMKLAPSFKDKKPKPFWVDLGSLYTEEEYQKRMAPPDSQSAASQAEHHEDKAHKHGLRRVASAGQRKARQVQDALYTAVDEGRLTGSQAMGHHVALHRGAHGGTGKELHTAVKAAEAAMKQPPNPEAPGANKAKAKKAVELEAKRAKGRATASVREPEKMTPEGRVAILAKLKHVQAIMEGPKNKADSITVEQGRQDVKRIEDYIAKHDTPKEAPAAPKLGGRALEDYQTYSPTVLREAAKKTTARQKFAVFDSIAHDIPPKAMVAIFKDLAKQHPDVQALVDDSPSAVPIKYRSALRSAPKAAKPKAAAKPDASKFPGALIEHGGKWYHVPAGAQKRAPTPQFGKARFTMLDVRAGESYNDVVKRHEGGDSKPLRLVGTELAKVLQAHGYTRRGRARGSA